MIKYYELIKAPIITEQSMKMIEGNNTYTFEVDRKANKVEIKKAIELIFKVTVLRVNTTNVKRKFKRMGQYEGYKQAYKKAYVTIAKGEKIDAFTI